MGYFHIRRRPRQNQGTFAPPLPPSPAFESQPVGQALRSQEAPVDQIVLNCSELLGERLENNSAVRSEKVLGCDSFFTVAECPALAGPGCTFADGLYADGSFLESQCLRLLCDSDHWVVTGGVSSSCGQCSLFLDPHLTTSDSYTTSLLQDPCQYSLIQTGLSSTPDVSIVSQFKDDCKGLGSCVDKSVFKDSPSASIEIGKDGLDAANIFTMEQCEFHQFMWSHPDSAPYYGVCGLYTGDGDMSDDLTLRDNSTVTLSEYLVPSFVFSWLTDDQVPSLCQQNNEKQEEHRANCTAVIGSVEVYDTFISDASLEIVLDACVFDLCLISQVTEGDQDSMSEWLYGPVVDYTERVIYLELASGGCQFGGQNYSEGERREDSCDIYVCQHGQWTLMDGKKVPSCCSSGDEYFENGAEDSVDCEIKICSCGVWEDKGEVDPTCCEYDGEKYEDGDEVTFDCAVQRCSGGGWVFVSDDPACCEYDGEKYEDGDEVTFDCAVQRCSGGGWVFVSDDPTCCEYNGEKYEDGEEVTFDCEVQRCSGGGWVFVSDDPTCCEYDGEKYEDGDEVTFDCEVQRCSGGGWVFVSDDPTCCEYDGEKYEDGEEVTFDCEVQRCSGGGWVFVSNDPACCVHNGQSYVQGQTVAFDCDIIRCNLGDWAVDSPDPNCCREGDQEYAEGETRTMDCKIEQCIRGTFIDTGDRDPNCCEHYGSLFPDGAITTIDCHIYSCDKGEWTDTFVMDPTCCEIGGRLFEEGTHAVVECYIFECMNGRWNDTLTMDPNCGHPAPSEHTEHREGYSGCDETEACYGVGGGIIIQIDQQVNRP
ncbi:hypothetical protein C7M84_023270 [Penaeus vannamei]|uniref:Uncharacterized protein n=1 Tax=Penaeus vannamei TaxID=6689 RepID=A0A423U4B3_PENVA|nr:hypothetical protein C7M84_023270 [Penaeus vannamei]